MAETLSYQGIRNANVAREADEQRTEARRKNLLILVLHFLNEEGYIESAQTLSRETSIDLNRYEVCDNVDLPTVLMEYESYYYIKFSKYPKITKKLPPNEVASNRFRNNKLRSINGTTRDTRSSSTPSLPRLATQQKPPTPPAANTRPKSAVKKTQKDPKQLPPAAAAGGQGDMPVEALALHGLVVHGSSGASEISQQTSAKDKPKKGQIIDVRAMITEATRLGSEDGQSTAEDRLLKPLGGYVGYNSEWRELAQVITRDIYLHDPDVRWDDIIGLENAKRLVKEAVVYPIKYPQLFTGILSPWKGLLLYGPPGTGKTLLAKAVATECNTTFFNISATSIVSKWRGDSEKLVRVLFELARFHAPSTIFLDELESLMSQRGYQGGGGEHEGSRRMKTELLVQMDGLSKSDDLVFLLAASNLPWELDHAMLRRLEKRILVDLPSLDARCAMFKHHLPPTVNTAMQNGLQLYSCIDYEYVAKMTEHYSGSDIRLVCKEAAMRPVRKIFAALDNHSEGEDLHINLERIETNDIEVALQHTKPSARAHKDKYLSWQRDYESV
ncbi:hypothetical protein NP493_7g01027 [Ridgeia piscesae]|uniref:Katanin p60 ATPase-containing subunit A-like 2 n=1 Tax=Ridgeia piscesae TaxID=27915 RepID=A0AAD9ULG0_RIDPI|nr:hypothetical protein NP493_7g01027 [Ridgeia piscesae]